MMQRVTEIFFSKKKKIIVSFAKVERSDGNFEAEFSWMILCYIVLSLKKVYLYYITAI